LNTPAFTIRARAFKTGWEASGITQETYTITGQVDFVQPVFSPFPGIYTNVSVTINNTIPSDAIVRYTLDGTDPTISSPIYQAPVALPQNSTITVKTKAFKANWSDSPVHTGIYTVTGQVAMTEPIYSPVPGTYSVPQLVTINTITFPTGATIHYTTDGTEPTNESSIYTTPIQIGNEQSVTIRARAYLSNWLPSEIHSANYTVTGQVVINQPVFTPIAGIYQNQQYITLNTNTYPMGAALYYTLDGTEPNESSTVYSSAIQLTENTTTTVKVRAYMNNWIPSQVYSSTYTITGKLIMTGNLFTPPAGIYTTAQLIHITADVEPVDGTIRYTTDGSTPDENSTIYSAPIPIGLNSENFVIKARAFAANWVASDIQTAVYTITGQVQLASEPFSIQEGIYTTAQTVAILPPLLPGNATIRYTIDGTDPTNDSPAYISPVTLPLNTLTTIRIKGFAENWIPSETISATYTITGKISPVIYSQPGGIYAESFSLLMHTVTPDTEIRYTLNGSDPNETSTLYVNGIIIPDFTQNLQVKAKAYKANWVSSDMTVETYSVLLLPINVRALSFYGYIRVLWNSPVPGRGLDGFNIYRKRSTESSFTKLNDAPITLMEGTQYYYDDYQVQNNYSYQYYITAIYNGVESAPSLTTTIEFISSELTISDASHAYPNPAVNSCQIKLVLSRNDNVQISVSVFDFAGKKVRTLTGISTSANLIEIPWDLKNDSGVKVARGTYFARIVVNDSIDRSEKVIKIAVK
jgi:hypothetical protein